MPVHKRLLPAVLLVVTSSLALAACEAAISPVEEAPRPLGEEILEVVHAVFDGDTVLLGDDRRTVRLIGINAPEREQPYYPESKEYLEALVLGRSVRLEADVERRDRHGRELAYLFLDDGTFVNLEMLRQGYAQTLTVPPNVARQTELLAAERQARSEERGLWRRSGVALRIAHVEANPRGPDEADLNGEWVEIENTGQDTVALDGMTLTDSANNTFVFPSLDLYAGDSVSVHSGSGEALGSSVYWDSPVPVWNNAGDTAFLRDRDGQLIDVYAYGP